MNCRRDAHEYHRFWKELTDYHGNLCFYCRKEVATCIDHVIPYSHDQDNSFENLVPACSMCNLLAGNKHFEDVEQKRQYILNKRKSKANAVAICTECLLPFTYRLHSPSLFLCAECYDKEYGTEYAQKREWGLWVRLLWCAGIPAEAHRIVRDRLSRVRVGRDSQKVRIETLVDEYANYVASNEEFAELLIRT